MVQFKSVLVVLLFLSASFSDDCVHSKVSGVVETQHCLEEAHQDDRKSESKQENENAFLNNDHIAESSSKTPLVEEVIESNGNGGIYEDRGSTTQYEKEDLLTSSLPPDAEGGGEGVYEDAPFGTREVLRPDHKEEGETVTDQSGNKNDAEINHGEDKTVFPEEVVKSADSVGEVKSLEEPLGLEPSEVRADDFMKSHIDFTSMPLTESATTERPMTEEAACKKVTNPSKTSAPEETKILQTPPETNLDGILGVNPPERLTMEETLGDDWKKDMPDEKETRKSSFQERFHSYPLYSQRYHMNSQPRALRLTMNENEEVTEEEIVIKSENDGDALFKTGTKDSVEGEQVQKYTTDTTSTEKNVESTKSISDVERIKEENLDEERNTTSDELKTTISDENVGVLNSSKQENDGSVLEKIPTAERFFAFNIEQENAEHNLNNGLETETRTEYSKPRPRPFRDYEDKSDEDKVVIKSLLNDYPSFKKEKIEPGVLFEDCPDCDLRVLPIRPSEQRSTPNLEEEPLPSSTIRFAELPEGRELQINTLGLSDGIFLFSYLSDFLSFIQPNEFPVELLRDALRSQMSWVSLITQSLQVEAGFVACMVAGVLLALAVPVVVLSHACYRMGGRQDDQAEAPSWGGNCKRRTLVFILQLLLILLFAGMVAMFATNEQLSSAVVQSSDVLQTSLNDISGFVHNSHLQLHFLVTQSLDQVVQAIYADLDNVDTLLGRPIQQELARETGLDVALDSLGDMTREAKAITQQVERFLDEARIVQEMLVSSREKLADLRQQVELFRRACGPRDRVLCDTIDSSGLDITFRLDRVKADERLNRMRRMGGVGLEAAAVEAKERFMSVPGRVEADTRDSREAVRRQLSRQRADVDERSRALEQFVREISSKVNEAKYQAGFWMQDLDQMEYWRWIVCMGGGAAVLMIWTMLLCSMCCGCCGSEKAAGPTILVTIVLMCLFSTALWTAALVGLIVGGHGEVFLCRPLYDEPDFPSITHLVDEPGVFYSQPHGGFIANVIYGNDSLDVPIKQVLQDCRNNRAIYPTLGLHRVFDAEAAVDQHRWGSVNSHVRAVKANLSALEVLSPLLQDQLQDLLATLSVNFTEHRIQMSKPVTGKDLDSFARQLDNIGNQMRDLATASRMETLSSRTRRLIDSHIKPLEGRKDALVYQLTALEVQTGPLQRQVNQSLSHLKTIQFFINSQGESIAHRKSREYVDRLLSYVEQLRRHVIESANNRVSPCRPLWDVFNNSRLFLCRHTMDPLNGYWFATMWCMLVLLVATPVCLKLVDYYRAQGARASGSPTENLMISEQGTAWSSPGYDIKGSKEYSGDFK